MEKQQPGREEKPEFGSTSVNPFKEIDYFPPEKLRRKFTRRKGKNKKKDDLLDNKESTIKQESPIANQEKNLIDIEDNPKIANIHKDLHLQNESEKPQEKKKRNTKRRSKTETKPSEDLKKKEIFNEGDLVDSFINKFRFKQNLKEEIVQIKSQDISEQPLKPPQQVRQKRGRKKKISVQENEIIPNTTLSEIELRAQNENINKDIRPQQNKKKDHITIKYDQTQEKFTSQEDEYFSKCKKIFPFEQPYDSQVESMKQILKSLMGHKNLLFQSPTGTGKTLMTICSALAYIENKYDTQILLLTRTNEQVNGLIKEIRKIKGYKDINQYAILAGRSQFCLKLNEFIQEQRNETSQDQAKIKDTNKQLDQFCRKYHHNDVSIQIESEETKQEDEDDDDSLQTVTLKHQSKIEENDHNSNAFQGNINGQVLKDVPHVVNSENSNKNDSYKHNPIKVFNSSDITEIDLTLDENNHNPNRYKGMCPYKSIHDEFSEQMQNSSLRMPYIKSSKHQEYTLPDIEDLKDLFKHKELGCPYYYNKLAIPSAKIVFATYNYVIKQKILRLSQSYFQKKNLIVIFDEGHNITDQAEQESTMELRKYLWDSFFQTLSKSQQVFSRNQSITSDNVSIRKLIRENLILECQEIKETIQESLKKKDGGYITFKNEDQLYSQDLNNEEFRNKKRDNIRQPFYYDDSDSSESESEEVYNFNEHSSFFPENKDKLNNLKEQENIKTEEMVNDYKNKFNVKSIKMFNLHDQIKMVIRKQTHSQLKYHPIIQNLQEILTQADIEDKLKKQSISSIQEELKIDQLLEQYKSERNKEIISFLDHFQSDFLIISEYCEHLIDYFDEKRLQNKELFCKLFIDNTLNPHLEKLNLSDSDETSKFLETIQKTYHMLKYIKRVIDEQTSIDLNEKKQEKGTGLSNILVVGDSDSPYKAETVIVEESVTDFAKGINLKSFKKIWCFYSKLHNMRRLQISQENPTYLQDHYFGILKDSKYQLTVPYLLIGCLSAKYLFQNIRKKLKISSLIFSSGTLEPFELMEKSIGIEFEKYSSPHVINPQTNLFTQFIDSFNDHTISFNFSQRGIINQSAIQTLKQMMSLFLSHSRKTDKKAGVIIFFKNYSLMEKYWMTIQTNFNKDFQVYKEPNGDASKFKTYFSSYKEKIETNKRNCIFLAVNRGKLSEGIDLKDNLCRTVILFGVPYPSLYDPYIKCKRLHAQQFLNEENWYEKVTVKVVNQSAGRCIRYKDDWGGIFFIDEQFLKQKIKSNISKWILDGQKDIEEDNHWLTNYEQFLNNKLHN